MNKSIILFMILSACVSRDVRTSQNRMPAEYIAQGNGEKFTQPKLNFSKFLHHLRKEKASTVAEALKTLSVSYPGYLTLHTLVYDSFSLQESSLSEPRAIVYGPEANFIFSFNGGTHQRGGYAIETLQFDTDKNEFQLREIAFKAEMTASQVDDLPAGEIEYQDERLKVSKANPARCTQCHGEKPQPIWDTYYFWPGVYGSNDDILTSLFNRHEVKTNPNYAGYGMISSFGQSQGRTIGLKPAVRDVETEGFKTFIAARANHPRFKYLPLRAIDTAYVRWNAGEEKTAIDTSEAVESEQRRLGLTDTDAHRPNLFLTTALFSATAPKFAVALHKLPARSARQIAYVDQCAYKEYEDFDYDRYLTESNILSPMSEVFTAQEQAAIVRRAGPWRDFLVRFLRDELMMESEKMNRFVTTFGADSLVSYEHGGGPPSDRPPFGFYQKILPKVPPLAKFITSKESDDVMHEALRNYVATGVGLPLEPFAVNLRRVATFREGGMNDLLSSRYLPDLFNADTITNRIDCKDLIEKLR